MDEISKIFGFLHISEKIFKCLDKEDLTNCRLMNTSSKAILTKQVLIELFDPLETAAMLAKVEEYPDLKQWYFIKKQLWVKSQKNRTLLSKTNKISKSKSK